MTILEPPTRHRCPAPRYRPRSEWRSMPVPPGWTKGHTAAKLTMPTPYPPGTVWVCACGRPWIRRPGQHYGRNGGYGYSEGSWSPLPWYAFRIRRRIDEHERACAYEEAKAIVDSYVLPEAR